MPDEQRKDPRSFDERLDAITMNLELQIRDTESLRQTMREESMGLRGSISELRGSVSELRGSVSELRDSVSELRDSVFEFKNTIQPAIEALLATALSHDSRIERLERRAS